MKEGITSLDLMFLVKELKEKLVDGKIQEIKQSNDDFIFEIYNPKLEKKRIFLKYAFGKAIYTTDIKQNATQPSDFCMILRKNLIGKTIKEARQHEFDRIIEIEADEQKIIFELFSTGNIVLVDANDMIIDAYKRQMWRDRILKPKQLYKHPPAGTNPFKQTFIDFQKMLKRFDREIVRVLAADFGFGGSYAEDFCKKLEIDKHKPAKQLNQQEADKLHRFFEQLQSSGIKPAVVVKGSEQVDVAPFDMIEYRDLKKVEFDSFDAAVQAYFEGLKKVLDERKEAKVTEKEVKKVEKIAEKQNLQLEELQAKEEKCRRVAQFLYNNYALLDQMLANMQKFREEGKDWSEVKQIFSSATDEKKVLKEIREKEAKVVINFSGEDIELDFRKSVKQNANYFFEEAKKAKEKIAGLQQAMKKFEAKPAVKKSEVVKPAAKIKPAAKKWYERYRWFVSSNGILVIAGKNARNNETIIKRYTRPQDLVLHADIHGSPFAVIRNDAKIKPLPAVTIYEAAELVATYSSAWPEKIGNIAVYYIGIDQLEKTPGLPAGSFQIKGERGWLEKIKPRLSIGIKEEENFAVKLIFGPPTAVKKQTPYLVTIVPGEKIAEALAEEIKHQLLLKVPAEIKNATEQIALEEIKKIIPYGKGELVT